MTHTLPSFIVHREQQLSLASLSLGKRADGLTLSGMTLQCSFFWARNAIFHCLSALKIQPKEEILVPAFICSAAVEPITAYGANVVFYDVKRNCEPSLEDLRARIGSRTRAVLVVHYFGFPQQLHKMRSVCDQYGLLLIEDCAHVLPSLPGEQPVGTYGDACVFSWRKLLPINDGAALYLKNPRDRFQPELKRESLRLTLRIAKGLLDQLVEQSSYPMIRIPYSWVDRSKKRLLKAIEGARTNVSGTGLDGNLPDFDLRSVNLPMTRLSRWILRHSTISEIIEKRRRNYALLLKEVLQTPGVTPLFAELPMGVCPWVFPVFFDSVSNAHLSLRQEGIPATSWSGVRSASLSMGSFPDSDFLYDNLVFLPIHQSLEEAQITKIVTAVKAVRASIPTAKVGELCHRQ